MKGHVLQEERAYTNKHFVFKTLRSVGTTCCICCVRWKGLEEVHNRAQQYLKFKRALETHSAQLQALLLISRIPEICSHTDRRKKLFCSVCNRTGTERLQTERQLLDQKRGGGGWLDFLFSPVWVMVLYLISLCTSQISCIIRTIWFLLREISWWRWAFSQKSWLPAVITALWMSDSSTLCFSGPLEEQSGDWQLKSNSQSPTV